MLLLMHTTKIQLTDTAWKIKSVVKQAYQSLAQCYKNNEAEYSSKDLAQAHFWN